jgi:hypothetical protein
MKIKNLRLFKNPVSLWFVSIILCAVSFEGTLSFPNVIKSSQSISQYLVSFSHALYVIAGVAIVIGIWRSLHYTPAMVIIWGIGCLGAALGGPLAFSTIQATFLRTSVIITLVILFLTSGLFLYTRNIIKGKTQKSKL